MQDVRQILNIPLAILGYNKHVWNNKSIFKTQ